MVFLVLFLWQSTLTDVHAEAVIKPPIVRNISLFRNEIQLDIDKSNDKTNEIKVGTKLSARTSVNHKCLLIVKKIVKDLAYADASQCPGYATLKKGQSVSISPQDEVNEEIRVVPATTPQNG